LSRIVAIPQQQAEAHYDLANTLKEQGRLEEATTEYRAAIRIKPDLIDASNNLGNALADLGKLEEAIAEYRAAIRIKPDDVNVHHDLGVVLSDQGKPEEAMVEYRAAMRIQARRRTHPLPRRRCPLLEAAEACGRDRRTPHGPRPRATRLGPRATHRESPGRIRP
jgi:tetratricopeptide (TPR) repeat protein